MVTANKKKNITATLT